MALIRIEGRAGGAVADLAKQKARTTMLEPNEHGATSRLLYRRMAPSSRTAICATFRQEKPSSLEYIAWAAAPSVIDDRCSGAYSPGWVLILGRLRDDDGPDARIED
ncbi:hypothetical protein AS156_05930 [Bradyrhizobium macuxiense]|uniref:Uncharacterized protein n=1 Tax=Bradyrhizobium macuxiense TaxID=1755647 RepID=A0A109JUB2_9BRAD|nr:hypothetical protein AS156_05930 [Bradyrhizobium macuxiense]